MFGSLNRQFLESQWWCLKKGYYAHSWERLKRRYRENRDTGRYRAEAKAWAESVAIPAEQALRELGILPEGSARPKIDPTVITEAYARAKASGVDMGGPADLELLYAAIRLGGAERVLETGVAYGFSSLVILTALQDREAAQLVSVDMPYPLKGTDDAVGLLVTQDLKAKWQLQRKPDRNGIFEALRTLHGPLDLCHYDSDKSYWGFRFAFPVLYDALRPGGIFISDDIQGNTFFRDFFDAKGVPYRVVPCDSKFVGILRKPAQ